jgi:hypothetical protein
LDSISKFDRGGFMIFSSIKNQVKKIAFQLFLLLIFITNVYVSSLEAQNKNSDVINFDTCETMVLALNLAVQDFKKYGKTNSYLVIIGGAMQGEKPLYNKRRIEEAVGYINHWNKLGDRIIFGTGKPEAKVGYLRFYVNGVLRQEIITRKNAKLCWGDGERFDFRNNKMKPVSI